MGARIFNNRIEKRWLAGAVFLLLLGGGSWLALFFYANLTARPAPSPTVVSAHRSPLEEAISKVEEARGEATGREVDLPTPAPLQHYADRRRFLAVQTAEALEQKLAVPHDYAELMRFILSQQLVELDVVGESYLLYGVGESASEDAFTHYDRESGCDLPLFSDDAEYHAEQARLTEAINEQRAAMVEVSNQLKQIAKSDREQRQTLQAQIAEHGRLRAALDKQRVAFEMVYKNVARRQLMMAESKLVAAFAADFGGQSYNLSDPVERRKLKMRLLSFLRPAARAVLVEIARAYQEKFARPLPVTSLVRTEQYQRHLSETNPNATRQPLPPHATGLAFDVYNGNMTAAEQEFLMQEIARLEAAGRVEALRENRDHIHVFAFADGQPPNEALIRRALTGRR